MSLEVIHVSDHSGTACHVCDAPICGPKAPTWTRGDHVVVVDGDPCASWRCRRPVDCTRGK